MAHPCCGMNQGAQAQAVHSGPTAGGSQPCSPTLSRDAKAGRGPGFIGRGRPAIAGWPWRLWPGDTAGDLLERGVLVLG